MALSVGGGTRSARAEDQAAPQVAQPAASPAALVAARELFREATADVDKGRFAPALEKFKRVATVKDTPPVRYNIGQCEEGLGRIGAALADYELAERQAAGDPKSAEVGALAHDRATALRPRVPRLTLALPGAGPDGLAITMDEAPVATSSIGIALPVDPGRHVVDATLAGHAPFHAEVDLKERATIRVLIEMTPRPPAAPDSAARRTAGFVVAGIGGALAVTSIVLMTMHNGDVSDLRRDLVADCPPNGVCATSDPHNGAHSSLRDSAVRDETLAVVFGALALAAVGAGAYLIFAPPPKPTVTSAWLSPSAPGSVAGLTLKAVF